MVIAKILPHFMFCSPIFLNGIFHHVTCLVNTDAIFTLNHINVEEFQS